MDSVEVRQQLVHALRLDLVGPEDGGVYADEVLPQPPSRWYLTGFLVPRNAPEDQRSDGTSDEELDVPNDVGATDDADALDPAGAKTAFFPSSMGLSVLVRPECTELAVTVRWGDYHPEDDRSAEGEETEENDETEGDGGRKKRRRRVWVRTPREERVAIAIPERTETPQETDVTESDRLKLAVSVRPVTGPEDRLPPGTRSVSVFLVNARKPLHRTIQDAAFVFQAQLTLQCDAPFIARPNLRGAFADDWDERVADLQYRGCFEYAVGHNVATEARLDLTGGCHETRTRWIPEAQVEHVAPARIADVELSMERLVEIADGDEARRLFGRLPAQYRAWIEAQRQAAPTEPQSRAETAKELLDRAEVAARRVEAGIELLTDPQVLEAFRLANKVMAIAARQRFGVIEGIAPAEVEAPAWRPFQLAFLLMNLPGIA